MPSYRLIAGDEHVVAVFEAEGDEGSITRARELSRGHRLSPEALRKRGDYKVERRDGDSWSLVLAWVPAPDLSHDPGTTGRDRRFRQPWSGAPRTWLLIVAAVGIVVLGVVVAVLAGAFGRTTPSADDLSLPISRVDLVALPGNTTRFDYADVDPVAQRLAVAHLGDDELLLLDTRTGSVVATVGGLGHVTGVIIVPSLHRVYASAPGTGEVVTIDEDSGDVFARAPAGRYPDGLTFVPSTGQVWISDQSGEVETVIDAGSGRRVATVALGGEAGNVRYDAENDRVLVAVQSRNEVAVIDPHTRVIERRVAVPGCEHDHGLLVTGGRAFVACDGNGVLVTLSLPDFSPLGEARVGDDPDVLAVDEDRDLLYVAAESGVVTTLDISTPAGRVTGRALLADNAHVVAVDASTGRAYFPLQDGGDGHPGLLITAPSG